MAQALKDGAQLHIFCHPQLMQGLAPTVSQKSILPFELHLTFIKHLPVPV